MLKIGINARLMRNVEKLRLHQYKWHTSFKGFSLLENPKSTVVYGKYQTYNTSERGHKTTRLDIYPNQLCARDVIEIYQKINNEFNF